MALPGPDGDMADPIDWRPLAAFLQARLPKSPPISIDARTPLLSSELLDSMALIELVAYLQKTFGIRIPSSRLTKEQFETVERIVQLVEALRSTQ